MGIKEAYEKIDVLRNKHTDPNDEGDYWFYTVYTECMDIIKEECPKVLEKVEEKSDIKKAYRIIKHMFNFTEYEKGDDIAFGARVAYVIALDAIEHYCPEVKEGVV